MFLCDPNTVPWANKIFSRDFQKFYNFFATNEAKFFETKESIQLLTVRFQANFQELAPLLIYMDRVYVEKLFLPYFPYLREKNNAISLLNLFRRGNPSLKIYTLNAHQNIDGIENIDLLTPWLQLELSQQQNKCYTLVAPDSGRKNLVKALATEFKLPYILLHKKRTDKGIMLSFFEKSMVIPVTENFLILDDLVGTGESILGTKNFLQKHYKINEIQARVCHTFKGGFRFLLDNKIDVGFLNHIGDCDHKSSNNLCENAFLVKFLNKSILTG